MDGTGNAKTDTSTDLAMTAADLYLFNGVHEDLRPLLLTLYLHFNKLDKWSDDIILVRCILWVDFCVKRGNWQSYLRS